MFLHLFFFFLLKKRKISSGGGGGHNYWEKLSKWLTLSHPYSTIKRITKSTATQENILPATRREPTNLCVSFGVF